MPGSSSQGIEEQVDRREAIMGRTPPIRCEPSAAVSGRFAEMNVGQYAKFERIVVNAVQFE
jgi:hypothetical protein